MRNIPNIVTRRHMPFTHDETQATGRDPKELGGMATPADGAPRGETVKIATTPLPETIGNVQHDEAMSLDEIRAWKKP